MQLLNAEVWSMIWEMKRNGMKTGKIAKKPGISMIFLIIVNVSTHIMGKWDRTDHCTFMSPIVPINAPTNVPATVPN
jgi:hypothetical protein